MGMEPHILRNTWRIGVIIYNEIYNEVALYRALIKFHFSRLG